MLQESSSRASTLTFWRGRGDGEGLGLFLDQGLRSHEEKVRAVEEVS